jgi:hypothetical protein
MNTPIHKPLKTLVGAPGFEPGTSCAQGLVARRINKLHETRPIGTRCYQVERGLAVRRGTQQPVALGRVRWWAQNWAPHRSLVKPPLYSGGCRSMAIARLIGTIEQRHAQLRNSNVHLAEMRAPIFGIIGKMRYREQLIIRTKWYSIKYGQLVGPAIIFVSRWPTPPKPVRGKT